MEEAVKIMLLLAFGLTGCGWYHRIYVDCGFGPMLRPCTVYDLCAAAPIGGRDVQGSAGCQR